MEIASGPTSQLRGANDWIVELVAIKDIKNGDGLSFHYCSTGDLGLSAAIGHEPY
jgi:hypothetical protein